MDNINYRAKLLEVKELDEELEAMREEIDGIEKTTDSVDQYKAVRAKIESLGNKILKNSGQVASLEDQAKGLTRKLNEPDFKNITTRHRDTMIQ